MKITLQDICVIVGEVLGFTQDQLKGRSQSRALAHARHIICWLAVERTSLSSVRIGKLMGQRDHTTVLHSVNKIAAMQDDPARAQCVAAVDHYANLHHITGGADAHALTAAQRILKATQCGGRVGVAIYTHEDIAAMASLLCTLSAGPKYFCNLQEPEDRPVTAPLMVDQIVVEVAVPDLMQAVNAAVTAWERFYNARFSGDEVRAVKNLGAAIEALRAAESANRARFIPQHADKTGGLRREPHHP